MKRKDLFVVIIFILIITACHKTENDSWQQMANGVWKYSIGTKEAVNLLDAANAIPNITKLNDSKPSNFPLDKASIKITTQNSKLYLRFPLEKNEQIYGLGLQFQSINRRGKYTIYMQTIMTGKIMGGHTPPSHFMSQVKDMEF